MHVFQNKLCFVFKLKNLDIDVFSRQLMRASDVVFYCVVFLGTTQ